MVEAFSAVTSQVRDSCPPGGDLTSHLWIRLSGVMTLNGDDEVEKVPSRPLIMIKGLISLYCSPSVKIQT